nr:MAG TPA: hypothetical protein [Caudoviricetes sp.]
MLLSQRKYTVLKYKHQIFYIFIQNIFTFLYRNRK